MAVQVDVRGSMDRIIADMQRVSREVTQQATVYALNKVADQVKTAASREMRAAGYKLKVSDIKKALKAFRATAGNFTAGVRSSGRPVPLIQYSARQTAKGVTVNVLNGRKLIKGAFIITTPNGHEGVFVRVGKKHKKVMKGGRVVWSTLPIKELFGPSVPDGLANKAVQDALQRLIEDKFPQILQQQIKRLL